MPKKVEITLVRSLIGTRPNQRKTALALGLKKLNHSVVKEVNEPLLGMIEVIAHLVKVVEKE